MTQNSAINLITEVKLLWNVSIFRNFSQFRVLTPTFLLVGIRCTVQIRFSMLKKGNRKTLSSVNSKLKIENWCEAIFSIKDKLISWQGPQRQISALISSPFRHSIVFAYLTNFFQFRPISINFLLLFSTKPTSRIAWTSSYHSSKEDSSNDLPVVWFSVLHNR